MKIKNRVMALMLVGFMLISGCKKDAVQNDAVDDTAYEMEGNVVLAVGDTEMTDTQFQFFLDEVKNQMKGTELSTDESWEEAEIEGRKAIDVAKERAYEEAADYLSMIEISKREGITCSDEEINMTKSQINVAYFDNYQNKDAIMNFICELNVYVGKLQEKFVTENKLTDAEIEAYFNENKEEYSNNLLRAKHVLILTQDENTKQPLPEEEIATRKVKADELLARAQGGEDFDKLVKEFSEDPGSLQSPDGYVFGSGEMVPEFENCVRGLGMNEIGFAETSYGYHIIKRLELDPLVGDLRMMIESEIYTPKLEEYMEEKKTEYNLQIIKNDEAYDLIK